MSLIYDYIAFVRRTGYTDIPEVIRDLFHRALMDTVGVSIRGAASERLEPIRAYAASLDSCVRAFSLATGREEALEAALLLGGYCAHVDDYDEAGLPGHTACVLVPAVLAVGQALGSSPREMMRALILGSELQYKLAEAAINTMYAVGWHTTSCYGTVAAAATSAILMGLGDEQFANALSIGASMAAGLMANFGTGTKAYHAGMAARNGYVAARMAQCGMTANPAVFEDRNGYFAAFCQAPPASGTLDFSRWSLEEHGMPFKQHPCCMAVIPTILGIRGQLQGERIPLEQVTEARVGLSSASYACIGYDVPQNVLEAKFSISFALGKLLADGDLAPGDFTDEQVRRPDLQAFMPRVRCHKLERAGEPFYAPVQSAEITLVMADGSQRRITKDLYCFTKPAWEDLVSWEELERKFDYCTADRLPQGQAVRLRTLLQRFDTLDRFDQVLACMR